MSNGNVGTIYYEVESDTSKLISSQTQLDGSLDRLNKGFKKTTKTANDTQFQMTKTAAAVKGLGTEATYASRQMSAMTKIFTGLLTLRTAASLLSMADAYGEMADRIVIATTSAEEYEYVQKRLLTTANATERYLKEAQELYLQSAQGLKSLGYNTAQMLDITDSLTHSFAANATSTQKAETAISAFSKATIRGRVDSLGWVAILTAAPTLLDDIAKATGKSIEEVNRLGVEGKISAQMLTEGLRQSVEANRALDASMSKTVAGSLIKLKNNLQAFVGEANRASGATQVLATAIGFVAEHIDTLMKVLMVAGAGALTKYTAQTIRSTWATLAASAASAKRAAQEFKTATVDAAAAATALAHSRANTTLAGSHITVARAKDADTAASARLTAATAALRTASAGLLAALGGPIGLITLLATAASAALLFGGNSKTASTDVNALTGSVDSLTASLNELGEAQLRVLRTRILKDIVDLEKGVESAERNVKKFGIVLEKSGAREGSRGSTRFKDRMDEERAIIEQNKKQIARYKQHLASIDEEQQRRISSSQGASAALTQETAEGQKYIRTLEDQIALLRVHGEERVKLRVQQELGDTATKEEIESAQKLAVEQYRLEQSQKGRTATTQAATKADNENEKAVEALQQELLEAVFGTEALAEAKALAALNEFATADDIAQVKALSAALREIAQAQKDRADLAKVDAIEGEKQRFEDEMATLKRLNEAKLLENERYLDLKAQAEQAHHEQMGLLQEENFRRQSVWNDMLLNTMDTLASASMNAFSGVVTGATSGREAMFQLSQAVMNEVVGAFIQLGMSQVKAWAMGKAAQMSAAAGYAASVSGQVAATTALAAQAAYASTAAIPIVGPSMAPAAAAMAGAAAGSLGAPAVAAAAASLGGGRQYGGAVDPTKMYRVNEDGKPEILNAANGQQYLLPNRRGEVVSHRDAKQASTAQQTTINMSMNITTPDADSFNRSRSQLEQMVAEMVSRATRKG